MGDPVIVAIAKGAWVLVAESVVSGLIEKMSDEPSAYYFTTRKYPSVEPAQTDPNHAEFDGVPRFIQGRLLSIECNEPTDIYALCTGDAGKVKRTV